MGIQAKQKAAIKAEERERQRIRQSHVEIARAMSNENLIVAIRVIGRGEPHQFTKMMVEIVCHEVARRLEKLTSDASTRPDWMVVDDADLENQITA